MPCWLSHCMFKEFFPTAWEAVTSTPDKQEMRLYNTILPKQVTLGPYTSLKKLLYPEQDRGDRGCGQSAAAPFCSLSSHTSPWAIPKAAALQDQPLHHDLSKALHHSAVLVCWRAVSAQALGASLQCPPTLFSANFGVPRAVTHSLFLILTALQQFVPPKRHFPAVSADSLALPQGVAAAAAWILGLDPGPWSWAWPRQGLHRDLGTQHRSLTSLRSRWHNIGFQWHTYTAGILLNMPHKDSKIRSWSTKLLDTSVQQQMRRFATAVAFKH